MDREKALFFFSKEMNCVPETKPVQLKYTLISRSMELFASISKENTISTWKLLQRQFLFKFSFQNTISTSAFTEDDKFIIVATTTKLNFLNLELKLITREIEIADPINGILDFSSRGQLVCSCFRSKLLLIDLALDEIKNCQLRDYVSCMVTDESFIYLGKIDGFIEIFSLSKSKIIGNFFTESLDRINCIFLNKDKQFLIVGKDCSSIVIVRIPDFTIEKTVSFDYRRIDSVVSLGNKIFVSSQIFPARKEKINLLECVVEYDLGTGEYKVIKLERFDNKLPILYSAKSTGILYADIKGNIRKFDLLSQKISLLLSNYSLRFESVCFDPQDDILYTGGEDGLIQVWDVNKKSLIQVLDHHYFAITCFLLIKSKGLLASGSGDADIIIWDLSTYTKTAMFIGHGLAVKSLAECSESRYILTYSSDAKICLLDLVNIKRVKTIFIDADEPACLKYIKKMRFHIEIFFAQNEWKIRVWKGLDT